MIVMLGRNLEKFHQGSYSSQSLVVQWFVFCWQAASLQPAWECGLHHIIAVLIMWSLMDKIRQSSWYCHPAPWSIFNHAKWWENLILSIMTTSSWCIRVRDLIERPPLLRSCIEVVSAMAWYGCNSLPGDLFDGCKWWDISQFPSIADEACDGLKLGIARWYSMISRYSTVSPK